MRDHSFILALIALAFCIFVGAEVVRRIVRTGSTRGWGNWIGAAVVIVAWMALAAFLDGPDEVQAAQDAATAVEDLATAGALER